MEILSFIGAIALIVVLSNRKERSGKLVDKAFDLVEWTVDQVIVEEKKESKGK